MTARWASPGSPSRQSADAVARRGALGEAGVALGEAGVALRQSLAAAGKFAVLRALVAPGERIAVPRRQWRLGLLSAVTRRRRFPGESPLRQLSPGRRVRR